MSVTSTQRSEGAMQTPGVRTTPQKCTGTLTAMNRTKGTDCKMCSKDSSAGHLRWQKATQKLNSPHTDLSSPIALLPKHFSRQRDTSPCLRVHLFRLYFLKLDLLAIMRMAPCAFPSLSTTMIKATSLQDRDHPSWPLSSHSSCYSEQACPTCSPGWLRIRPNTNL